MDKRDEDLSLTDP